MSIQTMTERLQSHDWAATPLGPMEEWPQSLRIAVGICMSSRFPMFIWWGTERINIYNDSYIPVLGDKHPMAFGRPAQPTWREIWDVVGPQADAVMRGEATWNERALLVMQRHGYAEDTWFTWSYSPIRDEQGKVGGLFCACTEETGRVVAERERDALLVQVNNERTRLAEAFSQSPSFLAILRSPEHIFEYVNDRYYELTGPRDLIGRTVREALPEVVGQGFLEILDRVYESGVPYVGQGAKLMVERVRGQGLEEARLDFVYQPVRDAVGEISGILAHGVDVTDRYYAEVRDRFLLGLEDVLRPLTDPREITLTCARLLAEHLGADRVAYADVEDDEDTFNLTGDFNRDVPSIVGRYRFADFGARMLADMRSGIASVVHDVETHQPPIADLTWYRKTMIEAVICVPLLKAGRFVAAMAAHQRTARHWMRHEVELVEHVASRCYESLERGRVERTLRESERSFRDLADSMPQIVFSANPDGHIDYFNRRWYDYTGLPEGSVGYENWRKVLPEEHLEHVLRAWPESLRTGETYEIEYPLRRHDGQFRWHLGRAQPVRDESGRILRWYGTNTDIDDRKQIEQALGHALGAEQLARHEAELASRMKDEFLATLSHELRTPLNAILGWSHMIRRDGVTAKDYTRAAEVIERNARAQARIIEDLLDMSAIISGKVRLEFDTLDLPAVMRAAIDTARPTADAKHIRLRTGIDRLDGVPMIGDAHRLQQVLWNLLTNALRFTPGGGEIAVLLRRTGTHVELCVSDSGQGIKAEFLPHVFDRFRQADASTTRQHGGLGLGLAIVKQLVELHGGSVRATSEGEGKGATFVVSLPIAIVPVVHDEAMPEMPPVPAANAAMAPACNALAGKRVLVVDDEADARDLMKQMLEQCEAKVVTAASSDEALRLAAGQRFDVLVSDIGMPGQDGYALIRKLRASDVGGNADIPAVALTAYARPEDRAKALAAGFQLHAVKPIDPGVLIGLIAGLTEEAA